MKRATELKNKARREFRRFGPGSSTAISSTAVLSILILFRLILFCLPLSFFDSMQKYKNNVLPLALPKPSSHA